MTARLAAASLALVAACGGTPEERPADANAPASDVERIDPARPGMSPESTDSPESPDSTDSTDSPESPDSIGAIDTVDGAALAAAWTPETIQLPGSFAPGLPPGVEELRFAPGMYDADATDYWSYAFTITFDEPLAGRAALLDVLEQYYTGLVTAVAAGRGLELTRAPALVELSALTDGRATATVDLVDAFVTGEPLLVHMDLVLDGRVLAVAASPRPRDHALWSDLLAVREHLRRGAGR